MTVMTKRCTDQPERYTIVVGEKKIFSHLIGWWSMDALPSLRMTRCNSLIEDASENVTLWYLHSAHAGWEWWESAITGVCSVEEGWPKAKCVVGKLLSQKHWQVKRCIVSNSMDQDLIWLLMWWFGMRVPISC